LDALDALHEHRNAVLLVGAQAIYLHTGEADLAVAPYTSDADLVLNPAILADDPRLDDVMRAAGFVPAPGQVGTWIGAYDVPIDLLVPEAVGGPGRRAARLGVHGDRVARKGRGLEAVLVDHAMMTIGALAEDDDRRYELAVAGPSALLVAKLHKIADRRGSPGRLDDKDALDVYRLLQAVPTEHFMADFGTLLSDPLSREVTRQALAYLEMLFGAADASGSQMAARAVELLEDPATIAAACAALAGDLLAAVSR
jgi:hypothetical protein